MEEKKDNNANGLLQLIAFLMCVGGIFYILIGIPLLLILGLGLIPMAIGALWLYYGMQVWKMKKNAYMGTMVMMGLGLIVSLSAHNYVLSALSAIILYVIYTNQEKFIN
jgi:uncharacterized membrane protein